MRSLQIGVGGLQAATLLTEELYSSRSAAVASAPLISRQDRCHDYWKIKLSMSEHVRDVVRKCRHIIRVLRCRGTNDQALQSASRLPVSRYRQAVERGLRLVGLYDGRRS